MLAFDLNAIAANGSASELCLIKILDAETLRLANEKMIEVRAIPVRVGNFIARTGRHEQLIATFGQTGRGGGHVLTTTFVEVKAVQSGLSTGPLSTVTAAL